MIAKRTAVRTEGIVDPVRRKRTARPERIGRRVLLIRIRAHFPKVFAEVEAEFRRSKRKEQKGTRAAHWQQGAHRTVGEDGSAERPGARPFCGCDSALGRSGARCPNAGVGRAGAAPYAADVIRTFYRRLARARKAKKLAPTACIRELLIILNAIVKSCTP